MINPNRIYKAKQDAVIVKIDSYSMPWVTIQTDCGELYDGYLPRAYVNWKRLKVGDRVGFSVQYSICAEKYSVATLVKRRAVSYE